MLAAAPLLWAYPKGGRITLGVRSSCHGRCMARLGTPGSPQVFAS